MFDKKSIPEITITPAKSGDFSITNIKSLREYKEQYACYD